MGERSERPAEPVRLVLEFGESVEVDGSTVFDPVAEGPVPAVVLRMPRARAAWFGRVLAAYTRVCRLAGVELDAAESGPAWALARAAYGGGPRRVGAPSCGRVTSARRTAAAAVLRDGGGLRRRDDDRGGRRGGAVVGRAGRRRVRVGAARRGDRRADAAPRVRRAARLGRRCPVSERRD